MLNSRLTVSAGALKASEASFVTLSCRAEPVSFARATEGLAMRVSMMTLRMLDTPLTLPLTSVCVAVKTFSPWLMAATSAGVT